MRALGLEPRTHGLKGNRTEVQDAAGEAVTSDGAPVCCPVYSLDAENGRAEPVNADPDHVAATCSPAASSPSPPDRNPGTPTADAEPAGTLAAAIALIDRLPLTDAEKAQAVRRLLAVSEPEGKP